MFFLFCATLKLIQTMQWRSVHSQNNGTWIFFICAFDSIYRTNISLYICIISKYCNFNTSRWKLIVFIEYIVSRILHDTKILYWTPIMFISQVFEFSKFYNVSVHFVSINEWLEFKRWNVYFEKLLSNCIRNVSIDWYISKPLLDMMYDDDDERQTRND